MKWRDKNSGKHPSDPDYDHSYDREEDYDEYLYWQELKDDEDRCK